jgi:predicted Zn finger-like uncharacterized protein
LFTQCSKCETVFKLSAEVLRAAGGQVRCGKCGEIFNALAHLAEDPSVFSSEETEIDLEFRADSILESPAPMTPQRPQATEEDFAPPGVEIARLQILDWNEHEPPGGHSPEEEPPSEEFGETSMEFTLPPGELDRIFVETKKRAPMPSGDSVEARAPRLPVEKIAPPGAVPKPPSQPLVQPAPRPATQSEPRPAAQPTPPSRPAPQAAPQPAAPQPATPQPPPPPLPATSLPPHPEDIEIFNAADKEPDPASNSLPSGFEVSEDIRREMLSGIESSGDEPPSRVNARRGPARRSASPFELTPQENPRASTQWLIGAAAAALLLIVQMVHHNREWLAAHTPLGGALRALYSTMGAPVSAPANLSAYQLRQWGVTGDPAADGTLRVRASILNTAAQLEAFPLLRVTLANRFGSSIGTRDFEPSEYLGKPTARLLAPGERVDATLDILDPGKSAEGFEIDVCLRNADRRVSCANDAAPAQAKR